MLERSIPEYREMRLAVAGMASRFARPGTAVFDLGCSRGEALASVRDRVAGRGVADVRYFGFEVSPPMLAAARERFADAPDVRIEHLDLRSQVAMAFVSASVVLSVLCLQFVPINHRHRIVRRAFEQLLPGGILILVEKVLGATDEVDAALIDLYHELKRDHGYTEEEVTRKAAALEGVLTPLTAYWNEAMLKGAGFRAVDVFWSWMNFRAWVAFK
jgi:tRNA (cmo5U34)-methyltransferase